MNIAILTSARAPQASPGGIANYIHNVATRLAENGHGVTIIARGPGFSIQEDRIRVAKRSVRVLRIPTIPTYPFHVHLQGIFVNKLVRMLEPELDLVHAHSPYVPAVETSLPVITTMHTLQKVDIAQYEITGLRRLAWKVNSYVFSSMESSLFENSEILTAVSGHVFHELKALYGIDREGVVLGNGVDETKYVPLRNETEPGHKYILYVGRIGYRKGLFDLIACAGIVCRENPDVSFVLVGTGHLLGLVRREARRLGIERNIVFAGHVSEDRLVEFYQKASVCVLPSHYEGLPTVLLEAMACGAPVVASRIGGHVDVVSDGLNGFLVPVTSPAEMADRILLLLDDQNLRERIGAAARHTIETQYTWKKVLDRVMQCYGMLLGSDFDNGR